MHTKHIVLLAGMFLSGLALRAQTLDELRTSYDLAASKLDVEREGQAQTVRVYYTKLLNDYIAYSQNRGQLEAVLWAQSEKSRFEEERTIRLDPELKIPEKIKRAQAQFDQSLTVSQLKWEQNFVKLTLAYMKTLEMQVKKLTSQGKIEEALALRDEITAVRESDEFNDAKAHFEAYQQDRKDELARLERKKRQVVLFEDTFDGELGKEWRPSAGDVRVEDGMLVAPSNSTGLNLDKTFTGNFRVEVDVVKRGEHDHSGWDFALMTRGNGLYTEILFRGDELKQLIVRGGPDQHHPEAGFKSPGTYVMNYRNGKAQVEYLSGGKSLLIDWFDVTPMEDTTLKFYLAGGGKDKERCIDAIRVLSLPDVPGE